MILKAGILAALLAAGPVSLPAAEAPPPAGAAAPAPDFRLKPRALARAQREALEAVSRSSGSEGAEALWALGLHAAAGGDWEGAAERWTALREEHRGSPLAAQARYGLAVCAEKAGEAPAAFLQFQALLGQEAESGLPQAARRNCQRLLRLLEPEDLNRLLQEGAREEFQAPLRLRLLQLQAQGGDAETLKAGLADYRRRYPQGPGLEQIEEMEAQWRALVPLDRFALGLLVPRSGPLAPFGQQVALGARLAVEQANAQRPPERRLRLAEADEGDGGAAAVAAARRLITKDKVMALLGPLSSGAAESLLPLLESQGVAMLSPSAVKPELAEASPWFFRSILTPQRQAAAMAEYAVSSRGLTRLACLAPANGYGKAMAEAFSERARELGAAVVVSLSYPPATRDFHDSLLALGGVDPGEAKGGEMDEKRDQQVRVEQASTAIGKALLEAAAPVGGAAKPAKPSRAARASRRGGEGPRLRLLVVDFAQDSASAELKAGRAFAERFANTLGQLEEVEVLGPRASERWWKQVAATPEGLDAARLARAGKLAGARFVLAGSAAEEVAQGEETAQQRSFSLAARLVDCESGEIAVQRRFKWSKRKPAVSNRLGLQALYLPGSAEEVARVAPGLAFFDLKLALLGGDQWDRPALREDLGPLSGAAFSVLYWPESSAWSVRRFEEAYRKANAAKPGSLAAQGYDAAGMLIKALDASADRPGLRQALSQLRGYEGVCGRSSFAGRQDAERRPAVVGVRGGGFTVLQEP